MLLPSASSFLHCWCVHLKSINDKKLVIYVYIIALNNAIKRSIYKTYIACIFDQVADKVRQLSDESELMYIVCNLCCSRVSGIYGRNVMCVLEIRSIAGALLSATD